MTKLTDEQHVLLAERLAEVSMENLDPETLERMVYDMYLDDFLMMSDSDLLMEAEAMEIEITVDESL
jgi:hypothetical protein